MSSHRSLATSGGVINPSNEDRISILSDDILCSIFSYLTTKEVVATCVLSKRWKYVWASTQELTIESRRFRSLSYYMRRFFTSRTLVKLTIMGSFSYWYSFSMPQDTFSRQSCVSKSYLSKETLFHVPCTRRFNYMQTLVRLLASRDHLCAFLEKSDDYFHSSSIPGSDNFKTEIDCPRIQYFEFHGESQIEFFAKLSSLVEAKIDGKCGFDNFNKISEVEYLVLSDDAFWGVNLLGFKNSQQTFNKLVKLELFGVCFYQKFLPILLDRSPNLEVIVFPEGLLVPNDPLRGLPGFYWQEPNSVPQCLISHLKKVIVEDFNGWPNEFEFLEYMLNFGEVLETVEIRCVFVGNIWAKMMLDVGLKNLEMGQKASSSCVIVVHKPH